MAHDGCSRAFTPLAGAGAPPVGAAPRRQGGGAAMSGAEVLHPAVPGPVDFAALAPARLKRMAEAGQRLIATARILAKTGDSVVDEVTRDCGPLHPYAHYPEGDVVDRESGAQFFYHLHPVPPLAAGAEAEALNGHFHCFVPAPEDGPPHGLPRLRRGSGMAHLIAVEVDRHSLPVRLFTTNRWVTDETWVDAPAAARLADRFVVELARPSLSAAIWISSLVRLFQPQIAALLAARDAAIAALARARPGSDPYEDRSLEVPSAMAVSVEAQMAGLRSALALRQA
jgi:hypothetical protein